jgi:hypothetical protein
MSALICCRCSRESAAILDGVDSEVEADRVLTREDQVGQSRLELWEYVSDW